MKYMKNYQMILSIIFIIFSALVLTLGIYIVNFSEANRQLIKQTTEFAKNNNVNIKKNDSLNMEALKNDSIIISILQTHFKKDSIESKKIAKDLKKENEKTFWQKLTK